MEQVKFFSQSSLFDYSDNSNPKKNVEGLMTEVNKWLSGMNGKIEILNRSFVVTEDMYKQYIVCIFYREI